MKGATPGNYRLRSTLVTPPPPPPPPTQAEVSGLIQELEEPPILIEQEPPVQQPLAQQPPIQQPPIQQPPLQQPPVHQPEIMAHLNLIKFQDERTELPVIWWSLFESYRQCLGMNEDRAIGSLPFHLTGQANLWFHTLSNETKASLDAIKTAFLERFQDNNSDNNIVNIRQHEHESGSDFFYRVQKMSLGVSTVNELGMVKLTINGLNDSLKPHVIGAKPSTWKELKDAIETATRIAECSFQSTQASDYKNKPFIGQVSKLNKNTVSVTLFNHNFQTLVDTGATVSCCSLQLLQLLQIQEHIKPSSTGDAIGAGGELHQIIGEIDLPVTIGDLVFNQVFHVFPKLYQSLILGVDFMTKNRVVLDLEKKTIVFPDKSNKEQVHLFDIETGLVRVRESVTVPPNSHGDIKIRISNLKHDQTVIIEPQSVLPDHGLAGAKSVMYNSATDLMVMHVMNPGEKAVFLPANLVVATASYDYSERTWEPGSNIPESLIRDFHSRRTNMGFFVHLFAMWILLTNTLTIAADVQRTNYGIVFQHQGQIHLGQENWIHTYEIRLPKKVQVPVFHQCPIQRSCYVINSLLNEINVLKTEVATSINETVSSIRHLIQQTEILNYDSNSSSRSRRGLLDFIGKISRSLFGTATVDDVRNLARHMNTMIKHENKLAHAMTHHEQQLSSFMLNTDERFENLMLAVNNTLIVKQINSSTIVNRQLESLKTAIHELVQGKISPYLISPKIISKTIYQIQSLLDNKFKGFKVLNECFKIIITELTTSSIMLYRTKMLTLSCPSGQQIVKGCAFCVVQLPCMCSASTDTQLLPARMGACENKTDQITILHPVNLALLQHFFSSETYGSIMGDTTFSKPIDITIPQFKIFNHVFSKVVAQDQQSHLSLKRMAKAAAKDQTIFSTLSDSLLDGQITINSTWPSLSELLTIISCAISVIATATCLLLFCKLKKLTAIVLMLQKSSSSYSMPLDSSVPSFHYKNLLTTTESPTKHYILWAKELLSAKDKSANSLM
ncbi:hypothetical protein KUTeg_007435, partial [Tegillarca granosa]